MNIIKQEISKNIKKGLIKLALRYKLEPEEQKEINIFLKLLNKRVSEYKLSEKNIELAKEMLDNWKSDELLKTTEIYVLANILETKEMNEQDKKEIKRTIKQLKDELSIVTYIDLLNYVEQKEAKDYIRFLNKMERNDIAKIETLIFLEDIKEERIPEWALTEIKNIGFIDDANKLKRMYEVTRKLIEDEIAIIPTYKALKKLKQTLDESLYPLLAIEKEYLFDMVVDNILIEQEDVVKILEDISELIEFNKPEPIILLWNLAIKNNISTEQLIGKLRETSEKLKEQEEYGILNRIIETAIEITKDKKDVIGYINAISNIVSFVKERNEEQRIGIILKTSNMLSKQKNIEEASYFINKLKIIDKYIDGLNYNNLLKMVENCIKRSIDVEFMFNRLANLEDKKIFEKTIKYINLLFRENKNPVKVVDKLAKIKEKGDEKLVELTLNLLKESNIKDSNFILTEINKELEQTGIEKTKKKIKEMLKEKLS